MTDFRLPFVNIDEEGKEHVTYQPSAMEAGKPYFVHVWGNDWILIKTKDEVVWYEKEKEKAEE